MLTDLQCKKATGREKPYRIPDERGLYLYVTTTGFRSWRMGYWFADKKHRIIFGNYPDLSLQDARAMRDQARNLVARGIDPLIDKKQKVAAQRADAAATFKAIALEWHAEQMPRWNARHASNVLDALTRDLFPTFGALPLSAITKPMVARRLKEIEARGAIETAKRHRQRMNDIYEYAQALGYDVVDPTDVKASLRPLVRKRWPAVTQIEQLRQMLWAIEQANAHPVSKLASRFLALTAVRPGVVQLLPWAELQAIDPADPVWIVPAERMKLSVERKQQEAFDHPVPLATQTLDVIASLKLLTGHGPLAFPSSRSMRRPISDSTISKLYRDNGYRGLHVPHGWRSSFSTVMNERAIALDRPGDRPIIDMMLGHVQDGVEPIYNRSAYLQRRRELAQEWADLLLEGLPPASALLIGPRR